MLEFSELKFIYAKENLSTKEEKASQKSRLSQAHAEKRWTKSFETTPSSRPKAIDCLIFKNAAQEK